ncbi:MAG: metalloregulator ArsR/SmtB family transcription factor [Desulfovibrionaceae bacterium]|nr:metalloregulator ArsR/SmtB family transcription factor [Desulfovibrionaceae bacterium]
MSNVLSCCKALADETRLRLIHILSHCELSVNELVGILEMGQSRVSRHLKILTDAGFLRSRRDGLWVFYKVAARGEAVFFLQALASCGDDEQSVADSDMAAQVIAERSNRTRRFFNDLAEHWDTLSREVLGGLDLPEEICTHLPPGCCVAVDLGCGTGNVLERLREKSMKVIGVDGSPRMLELAKRRLQKLQTDMDEVSLRIGDLHHLPLRDEEADFVSICMVLHHLNEPIAVLREAARVLRPGGFLVIADFDKHSQEWLRTDYGDLWLGFDSESLHLFLKDAGFSFRSEKHCSVNKGLALNITVAERL